MQRSYRTQHLRSARPAAAGRPACRTAALICLALFLVSLPCGLLSASPLSAAILAGGSRGLYLTTGEGGHAETTRIWDQGSINSIVAASKGWYFTSSEGVVFSPDLKTFRTLHSGLPVKVLKVFECGAWMLKNMPVPIKAVAVDPAGEHRLAACTDTEIFFSETSGETWISLGTPSAIPGIRTLSFGPSGTAGRNAVWVSHALRGVHARDPDDGKGWINRSAGIPKVFGNNIEEVSCFGFNPKSQGAGFSGFFAGLSFLGRLLQWDSSAGAFTERYSGKGDHGSVESLQTVGGASVLAIFDGTLATLSTGQGAIPAPPEPAHELAALISQLIPLLDKGFSDTPRCMARIPSGIESLVLLKAPEVVNELWRLGAARQSTPRGIAADGKQGLYLQTGFAVDPARRERYFSFMEAKGLDSVVIDVKDDYGKLRFSPRSPILASMGVKGEILDLEAFTSQAKARGIYVIARIVVFKDEALFAWNNGTLAVRDSVTDAPWRGVLSNGQTVREHWVDPYSNEVWTYNVEIAREVLSRGFDEVQFDYIRFPTDGTNLDSARYPHRSAGMTQDSALESFLMFARSRIDAPISVDIYGANGWYRSGTRTGQNVEMLADYVDVICPMLYPSHFEQEFLAQDPAGLRPYRIYKLGTLRNLAIARNSVIVRPYVQAFYLDVAYDRMHYGPEYVKEEIRGVREGANQGMTFWNNSGRYDDIPVMGP